MEEGEPTPGLIDTVRERVLHRPRRHVAKRHVVGFGRLMALASGVGLCGGLLAAAYYFLLSGALSAVWNHLAPALGAPLSPEEAAHVPPPHPVITASHGLSQILPGPSPIWVISALGGVLVGLALWKLGTPGEISAVVNNIHVKRGRIDIRQTPSMVVISLLSISFGGSAGPEAPLVQIIGSLGSWVGDRLRLHASLVRTLTFCGMSAALGAFFGAPLGGALFALEIPHRRGLEYYEALVPSVVAATLSYVVFRAFVPAYGPFGLLLPVHEAMPQITLTHVLEGIGFGVFGGAVGVIFIYLFRTIGRLLHPMRHRSVVLGAVGGLSIGVIALLMPAGFPSTTFFWGEYQIGDMAGIDRTLITRYGLHIAIALLVLFAFLKMVAVGMTLHSGFRGGFIFPLFLIGAALGMAVSIGTHGLFSAPVAMLCTMAAVNVAVTKTPISSAVILTTVSGTSMLPVIGAACLASFVLTTRVSLIETQRSRAAVPPPLSAEG
ncbi:MAG TPA: chloride channel protein [Longimicrobiaceae bacterium]|nr:chloride channel protein [Longimicrobiaceae bacterium]